MKNLALELAAVIRLKLERRDFSHRRRNLSGFAVWRLGREAMESGSAAMRAEI
jgi:hypothetical protein